ncbi:MAG: cation-translocating P-type ATPase [Oscillospiraceae bacterium]|nr:cation-translocating P-type ATPase [Oscillospiraceae bacterium]
MNNWYMKSAEQSAKEQKTDLKRGLSAEEAAARLLECGENKLSIKGKPTFADRLTSHLKDFSVILIIVAAFVSAVIALNNGESLLEPFLIVLIVMLKSSVTSAFEMRTDKKLEEIFGSSSVKANVIRNGKIIKINSLSVVPGDIVLLKKGDIVIADGRITSCRSFVCNDSTVFDKRNFAEKTSAPFSFETPYQEHRSNMVYSGAYVLSGTAAVLVTETGVNTELGKKLNLVTEQSDGRGLRKRLFYTGNFISMVSYALCALVFFAGIINGMSTIGAFIIALALSVTSISDTLPEIAAFIKSNDTVALSRSFAVAKKHTNAERIRKASVILVGSDIFLDSSTASVNSVWVYGEDSCVPLELSASENAKNIVRFSSICMGGIAEREMIADSCRFFRRLDTALDKAIPSAGEDRGQLLSKYPRCKAVSFDHGNKILSSVHRSGSSFIEILLSDSKRIFSFCPNIRQPLIEETCTHMYSNEMAPIFVACRIYTSLSEMERGQQEDDAAFIGILGIKYDICRDSEELVSACFDAGIRVVIASEQPAEYVQKIASDIGVLRQGDRLLSSEELSSMPENELLLNIRSYSVFTDTTAADRLKIVNAWQEAGEATAAVSNKSSDNNMLIAAHASVSSGEFGSGTARDCSDIILNRYSFKNIFETVKLGRSTFDKTVRLSEFVLCGSLCILISVLMCIFIFKAPMLSALQILIINFVTVIFSHITFTAQPPENVLMRRKPAEFKNRNFFKRSFFVKTILSGLIIGIISAVAFSIGCGEEQNIAAGQTMAFAVCAFSQIVHLLCIRSPLSLFSKRSTWSKPMLAGGGAALAVLLTLILLPALAAVFGFASLTLEAWMIIIGLSLSPVIFDELYKLIEGVLEKRGLTAV